VLRCSPNVSTSAFPLRVPCRLGKRSMAGPVPSRTGVASTRNGARGIHWTPESCLSKPRVRGGALRARRCDRAECRSVRSTQGRPGRNAERSQLGFRASRRTTYQDWACNAPPGSVRALTSVRFLAALPGAVAEVCYQRRVRTTLVHRIALPLWLRIGCTRPPKFLRESPGFLGLMACGRLLPFRRSIRSCVAAEVSGPWQVHYGHASSSFRHRLGLPQ
jgi:hypothetical protein